MTEIKEVDGELVDIKALLAGISKAAVFYIGIDADEFLYARAAGNGLPYETAWCNKGWRTTKIFDDEEPMPLTRKEFLAAVLARDYFLESVPADFYDDLVDDPDIIS